MWYSAGIPPGILIWRGILGIPAKNLGISWYTQTLLVGAWLDGQHFLSMSTPDAGFESFVI